MREAQIFGVRPTRALARIIPSVCPPETSKEELSFTTTGFCSGILSYASCLCVSGFKLAGVSNVGTRTSPCYSLYMALINSKSNKLRGSEDVKHSRGVCGSLTRMPRAHHRSKEYNGPWLYPTYTSTKSTGIKNDAVEPKARISGG